LKRKSVLSLALFALAFSFKAQAFFFAPFLFMLFVQGEITLSAFAIVPLVCAVMLVPAILVGVDWQVAATTYIRQGQAYHILSEHAPNLYYLFGDHFYGPGVVLGLILAAVVCFALALLPRLRNMTLDINTRLLAATMFLAVAPFLLPKMHDRYFFAADLTSIVLAVYIPRLWIVPIILQISSLSACVPMMSWTFSHRVETPTMPMAVMLCTVVVGFLVHEFWRACMRPNKPLGEGTRTLAIAAIAIIAANVLYEMAAEIERIVASRACRSGVDSLMCVSGLPGDWTLNGNWPEWMAYAVIQVGCFFVTRWAVRRLSITRRDSSPVLRSESA
jgi:hypothetical protein